jgi:predicted nucleic acid-binding protein
VLVLDSGGLSRLAARTKTSVSLIRALTAQELWPPLVPTIVLVESLQGDAGRDANTNRFLKTCIIESTISVDVARRAAELRRLARRGSAVDALVVAIAEPGGTILTGDRADIEALAAHANRVSVQVI